jgi:serine/threonine-protein kinase HipA
LKTGLARFFYARQNFGISENLQYEHFDTELAMAFGDAFTFGEIKAFALADFAVRCGVDRKLMRREAQRLASAANKAAADLAQSNEYRENEREFVERLAASIGRQAQRLADLAREAAAIPAGFL